jgi:hypothetical protein
MEQGDRFSGLSSLVPDYLCGIIWICDISLGLALSIRMSEVEATAARWSKLLTLLSFPDIAVTVLVVAFGVLLPYALAIALNPLSSQLATWSLIKWYVPAAMKRNVEQNILAATKIADRLGAPMLEGNWSNMFMLYLEHVGSPAAEALRRQRQVIYVQARVALPLAVLSALFIYVVARHSVLALMLALVEFVALLAATIHFANIALLRWDDEVIFAFLAVMSNPDVNRDAIGNQVGPKGPAA